ncbi:MAG: SYNERG-CTERM sorting domain-containing protein [Cloacibacillus porcorum]|uniref:Synerg-CTERM sorting domain-containing protein n=1 Tax=Cloacibacillus porcorum TaxID=1197717 RepID=UPI0023F0DFF9|nr:Synerg-CTERM sorting domain-containing protein [Cloacibacillus porcorum]MCD7878154.1 SYNERG-CTERM sorting domain-containing protein [Cloacibacillus porcorum]
MDLNGKNIDGGTVGAVALKDNKLYIASISGAQSYNGVPNPGSNIDVVNLDTMDVKELISVKTLKDQYSNDEAMFGTWSKEEYPCDFKSIVVTPAGDVYIIANGWNPNTTAVFKTTEAELGNAKTNAKTTWKMVKAFYFGAFVFPGAAYDAASEILYVCGAETGEYNGSLYKSADGGASWTKYDSAALGGAFSAVAFDVLLKPTTADITSKDVTVHSDAGSVTMSSIEVSGDVSELSGKDDYSSLVNGVAGTQTIYAGRSIIVNINHSTVPDSAPVTFTIANFSMELHSGGAPKAFIKKHGSGKFDMFNATYDAAAKTLTFTISPVDDYFSEGKIIVGELADKPAEPTSPTSEGASGGGCNAGYGLLALLALVPAALRRKKG